MTRKGDDDAPIILKCCYLTPPRSFVLPIELTSHLFTLDPHVGIIRSVAEESARTVLSRTSPSNMAEYHISSRSDLPLLTGRLNVYCGLDAIMVNPKVSFGDPYNGDPCILEDLIRPDSHTEDHEDLAN
ncbi:uncharacterized protein LOC143215977 isoform X1 [Lasioglossum baleicum]|uniref:uncharacterized protein LOC143215977 isoform X1 n=1 Tax=Lasioglossum baleicum TaxID=434251 RepID=UPI003FCD8106